MHDVTSDPAIARAEALRHHGIPGSGGGKVFDDLARLAALVCETRFAVISFPDGGQGGFLSGYGPGLGEWPAGAGFCHEALLRAEDGFLELEDAAREPHFRDHPLVVDEPGIRFFAGVVLEDARGVPLGMLCVLDPLPRRLEAPQREALGMLAHRVVEALEFRLLQSRMACLGEGLHEAVFTLDGSFRIVGANAAAMALVGGGSGADAPLWVGLGEDAGGAIARGLRESAACGRVRDFRASLSRDGGATLLDFRTVPSPDGMGVFVREAAGRHGNEEQLRVLGTCVASLNDIVLITEADPIDEPGPRIVYANPAFLRVMGYPLEEVLGRSPRFLQGEATQREALDRIRAGLTRCESCREELINYTKAGEMIWLELEIVPVPDAEGRVTHFISVERDVTERKRQEAIHAETVRELHERVKELQALHETSHLLCREGITDSDLLARTADTLRAALQDPAECGVTVAIGDLVRVAGTGCEGPDSILARFECPSGAQGFIRADHSGGAGAGREAFLEEERFMIESVATMLRFHFDRVMTREALQRSEQRYRLLFSNNPQPMWVFDLETLRFLEVNEAAEEHYGYSREEFLAMTLPEIRPSDDVPALRERIHALEEGVQHGGVWRHRLKDGRIVRMDIFCYVLTVGGRREGLVLAMDVTERVAAEEALRINEKRLSLTQRIAKLGSLEIDSELKRATCSNEALSILGIAAPAGLLDYERFLGAIPVEDRERVRDFHRRVFSGEGRLELDHRVCHADGSVRWVHELGELQPRPRGGGCYLAAALVDITDRKLAEQRLRESEERFRLVSRATNDVLWDWDLESGFVKWSDGYERLLGRDRDEVAEGITSWTDHIHPEDVERVVSGIHAVIDRGGVSWDDSYRMLRADGSVVHVLDRGEVRHDASGKPSHMTGGMTDITEINEARGRMREQAVLLNKANDAILVRGLDHHIISWNRGAERLYGHTAEEVLGRSIDSLLYPKPDLLARFDEATRITVEEGGWTGELEQIDKEGRSRFVKASWTLLRDDAGNPASILAINTDITEQRLLERQFMRTQRLESLGTLAGGIAHDLNNVLTPILLSIDLLKSEAESPERIELFDALEKSARRGADMVKQVLAFGRGVDGQQRRLSVPALVGEIVKIARETFPKSIEVGMRFAEDLRPVLGDSTQLHQVLLNLAVNARDAMPDGGRLVFEASNHVLDDQYAAMNQEAAPGPYVMVGVEDTGSGMPPEVLDRVFEPFFTTKEIGSGTGLGLSTSLAIIKSHGGFIRVYSEPGQGTRFRVYLPAFEGVSDERSIEAFSGEAPRGSGETVLVVDDEAVVRDITAQTLETFGYRVMTAGDGAEGVAVYADRRGEIDVVLTDMMMPIMDGPSMIRVILKLNPAARIVAASGLNANGMVAKAANTGVKNFIPKPYTAEALLHMIASVLEGAGRE